MSFACYYNLSWKLNPGPIVTYVPTFCLFSWSCKSWKDSSNERDFAFCEKGNWSVNILQIQVTLFEVHVKSFNIQACTHVSFQEQFRTLDDLWRPLKIQKGFFSPGEILHLHSFISFASFCQMLNQSYFPRSYTHLKIQRQILGRYLDLFCCPVKCKGERKWWWIFFSNSWIIHQVKRRKVTGVNEVWIPGLN